MCIHARVLRVISSGASSTQPGETEQEQEQYCYSCDSNAYDDFDR